MSKFRLEVRSAANRSSPEPMIRIEADWTTTIGLFAHLAHAWNWQGSKPFPDQSEIPEDFAWTCELGTSAQFDNHWTGIISIQRLDVQDGSIPYGARPMSGEDIKAVASFREELKRLEGNPFQ